MGRVGEHSLTRRRRRAGALATASPTTRRRPTHYAHYLSARGGGRHSPTSSLLARGPLTTRTNLVRGVAGGTHFRALRVSARSSRARLRPPAKGTTSGPPDHSPRGRPEALTSAHYVSARSVPASDHDSRGSTSPLDPPRRTTSPRPAHRLTCADLVPRRAREHSLTAASVLFTRPGEGSWYLWRWSESDW